MAIQLNPLTRKKLQRFRSIRRGFWSFMALVVAFVASLIGELLVNKRALVVSYDGKLHFPVYGKFYSGEYFGLEAESGQKYSYEVNYRQLEEVFKAKGVGGWVLMPLVPYDAYENDFTKTAGRLSAPSVQNRHLLGTDETGRYIFARLFYGFRIAMIFSLGFLVLTYLIGVTVGSLMGYFGGVVDLLSQRLVEIWANIPFLYMVIIIVALVPAGLPGWMRIGILLLIMVLFSWTSMTYYVRAAVYKEKARDYVAAANVLGAGPGRIIFKHLLPNVISTLVTFAPFTVAMAISSITALDFLGFGLPPPTPSWGELLKQGVDNLREAPWIVASGFLSLVVTLTLVTFVGEAVREAFDPKKFATYE